MGIYTSKNYVYPIDNDIENNIQTPEKTCFICLEECNVKMKCKCVSYCHKNCFEGYLKTRRRDECPFCRRYIRNIRVFSPNLIETNVDNIHMPLAYYIKRAMSSFSLLLLVVTIPQLFTGFLASIAFYYSTNIHETVNFDVYINAIWLTMWLRGLGINFVLMFGYKAV